MSRPSSKYTVCAPYIHLSSSMYFVPSIGYVVREGGIAPRREALGTAVELICPESVTLGPQISGSLNMKLLVRFPPGMFGLIVLKHSTARAYPELRLLNNVVGK